MNNQQGRGGGRGRFNGGRNQYGRNGPRGNGGQGMVPRAGRPPGSIPELPILRYGKAGNLDEFTRELIPYCERNFRELALIFSTNEYFVPAEIEPPNVPFTNNNITPEEYAERIAFEQRVKNRENLIAKNESDCIPLFSLIWNQLSAESKQVIMQDNQWEALLQNRNDPLALWQVINQTHTIQAMGNEQLDRMTAREAYNRLRQGDQESLVMFKERYDRMIRTIEAYGIAAPEAADQAADFINKLDQTRYAQFKVHLANNAAINGLEYPQDLVTAYNAASRYKILVPSRQPNGHTTHGAFTTVTADNFRSNNKRYHNKANNKKGGINANGKKRVPDNNQGESPVGGGQQHPPKRKGKCHNCGQPGHWAIECPNSHDRKGGQSLTTTTNTTATTITPHLDMGFMHIESITSSNNHDQEIISVSVSVNKVTGLKSSEVLLDNQATKSVFIESSLLTNIHPSNQPVTFVGIGGSKTSSLVGTCREFGVVSFIESGVANILSFSAVENKFAIEYRPNYGFIVTVTDGGEYHFKKSKSGLYVCDFDQYPVYKLNAALALVQTVAQNEQLYTKREVEDARKAREIMKQLAYPSIKDMVAMIKNGVIVNLPITVHDVYRAFRIYGPDIASLKGKTKLKTPLAIKAEYIPRPLRVGLVMHSDIMFIDKDPYLVTVTTPLGLTVVHHLNGTTKGLNLLKRLKEIVSLYKTENFVIENILTDGDSAMLTIVDELNALAIRVEVSGSGQHVPLVENKIRQIKERVRAHVTTLPYLLPKFLMRWLVFFCTMRLNMLPNKSRADGVLSPIELFKGRKIDYKRDVRIGFGEYVQAANPNITPRNSMVQRTDGALSLIPVGNLQGSVRFYSLSTNRVIVRDHWTVLPMPQIVIDHINHLANKYSDDKDPSTLPEFAQHNPDNIIPDDGFTGEDDDEAAIIDPPTKLSGDGTGDQVVVDPTPELAEVYDSDPIPVDLNIDPNHDDEADDNTSPEVDTNIMSEEPSVTTTTDNHDPTTPTAVTNPDEEEIIDHALEQHLEESALQRRHSVRARKPNLDPRYYYPGLPQNTAAALANIGVKRAKKLFGDDLATKSIQEELKQHVEKGTWKLLTPAEVSEMTDKHGDNVTKIDTMIFTKEKYNASGELEKVKSRLVARGDMQDRSMYSFEEISAQVATLTSALSVAVISAKEGRNVRKVDIAGAYLNATIKNKIILIRLDPDVVKILLLMHPEYANFLQPDGSMIGWLIQALYGCIESAELWNENISKTLIDGCGYTANTLDRCVFNKFVTDTDGTVCQSTILVYVDDLLITCKSSEEIERITDILKTTYKKITIENGPVINYLGMVLDFAYHPGAVHIDMSYYIGNCLDAYNIRGVALTPGTQNLFIIDPESPELDIDRKERFHSCVAKLLFCAKRVRYDILTAISFLSTRVNKPTIEDDAKLQRVLKYLNGIPDIGITLESDQGPDIIIHAYVDASFGVHADGKSHSGIAITLGKGCVYVRSAKQVLVTKSSAEAELVAASDELSQVIWLREFLIAQGYPPKYTFFYQDNMSTMAMINRGRHTSLRTRHIHVRYFFIADRIEQGEIVMKHCGSDDMIADIMTKPLQGHRFRTARQVTMNLN